MATSVISAVHDDDLVDFLKGLGVFSAVERGDAKCKFSGDPVNLDNLGAVFPESGDVKFVCDRPACLALLAEHRSEVRGHEPRERARADASAHGYGRSI